MVYAAYNTWVTSISEEIPDEYLSSSLGLASEVPKLTHYGMVLFQT